MPTHWTYSEWKQDADLCQGDIIRRSPELLAVLDVVHKHFCDEKYIAFLVLTQTCDLVRRSSGECKARHVTLSVVRELDQVLPLLLDDVCGTGVPGVYKKESRYLAEQLLVRILNQNEQARGLFYLHPDADVGIGTPSLALLRISIALRREHYEVLRTARCGRVASEFSAKLGWLTGNLYSRVATQDWDEKEGKGQAEALAKESLDSVTEPGGENWVSESWLRAATKAKVDLTSLDRGKALSTLRPHAPPEPIEIVTKRVDAIGRELVRDDQTRQIRDRLRQDGLFVEAVAGVVAGFSCGAINETKAESLRIELQQTDAFCEAVANQVQSIVKQGCGESENQPVELICSLLESNTGTIRPVQSAIQKVWDELGFDSAFSESLGQKLNESRLFTDVAVGRVRAVVAEVLSDGSLERIKKLAGRIGNDSQVTNALREQRVAIVTE